MSGRSRVAETLVVTQKQHERKQAELVFSIHRTQATTLISDDAVLLRHRRSAARDHAPPAQSGPGGAGGELVLTSLAHSCRKTLVPVKKPVYYSCTNNPSFSSFLLVFASRHILDTSGGSSSTSSGSSSTSGGSGSGGGGKRPRSEVRSIVFVQLVRACGHLPPCACSLRMVIRRAFCPFDTRGRLCRSTFTFAFLLRPVHV